MDLGQLAGIFASLPDWASEDTMTNILRSQRSNTDRNIAKINKIAAKWGLDPIETQVDDIIDNKQKGMQDTRRMSAQMKQDVNDLMRENDPLLGLTAGITMVGGAMGQVGKGFDFLTGNKASSFLKKSLGKEMIAAGNKGLGALAGVAGFSAGTSAFIMSLERDIRAMVEMSVFTNTAEMQYIKEASTGVGMSMVEATKMLTGSSAMVAAIGDGDVATGTLRFLKFASQIEKMNANGKGGISDFGLGVDQLATRMAQETALLYDLNELTDTNLTPKGQAYKNFETMEGMMTYMADWTGVRKSELLDQGMQADAMIDYRMALKQNKAHLEAAYGEGTMMAVNNGRRRLAMQLAMVPELQTELLNAVDKTVNDIQYNGGDSVISFNQEFLDKMNVIDPQLATRMTNLVSDIATGQFKDDPIQQDIEVKRMLQDISNAKTLDGPGEMFKSVNTLITTTNLIPNLDMSDAEQREKAANVKAKAEQADDIIDAVDNTRKALRQGVTAIAPSTNTVVDLFGTLTGGVQLFGKAVSYIPGFEQMQSMVGEDAIGNYRIDPSTTDGPQMGALMTKGRKDGPDLRGDRRRKRNKHRKMVSGPHGDLIVPKVTVPVGTIDPNESSFFQNLWDGITGKNDDKNEEAGVAGISTPFLTKKLEETKSMIDKLERLKGRSRNSSHKMGLQRKIDSLEKEIAKILADIAEKTKQSTLSETVENGK
jgi:hypothetical protein